MANLGTIVGAVTLAKVAGVAVVKGIEAIKGGIKAPPVAAAPTVTTAQGTTLAKDMRVKIRVPDDYSGRSNTSGYNGELFEIGGIIFPYTPSISYEHKTEYSSTVPLHSNYAINFYKNSSITPITISGKFTVQNEKDAGVYLATVHLLRALTKMKFGTDTDAGSPPPVCRLDAYGTFMLENVPVAISNFKIELPDGVDYYTTGKTNQLFEETMVPTLSTISVTCIPMYSRDEMQKFSVDNWLSNSANARKAGYL